MSSTLYFEKELESASGKKRVDLLNDLAYSMHSSDSPAAEKYILEAAELAHGLGYRSGEATSILVRGLVHFVRAVYSSALAEFEEALNIFEAESDKQGTADALRRIGHCYRECGDHSTELEYYLKARDILEEIRDKDGIATNNGDMGFLFWKQGDNDRAREHLLMALAVFEKRGNLSKAASMLSNLGFLHFQRDEYDQALEFFTKSIQVRSDARDSNQADLAATYGNIGQTHYEKNDYAKALEYCDLSLRLALEGDFKSITIDANCNLGKTHLALGDPEKARPFLDEAVRIAREIGSQFDELECCQALAKLAEMEGDYEKACDYLKRVISLRSILNTEEKKLTRSRMQTDYEIKVAQREAEIHRLENVDLHAANEKLQEALNNVKRLHGLFPICAWCKKIRDDEGYWNQIDEYISERSEAEFSHSICPSCNKKSFTELQEQE